MIETSQQRVKKRRKKLLVPVCEGEGCFFMRGGEEFRRREEKREKREEKREREREERKCVYGPPSQGFTLEGPRVAPSTLIS